MKLILDAMGGDNAPLETVKGAVLAAKEYPDTEIVIVGREAEIRDAAEKEKISLESMSVMNADEVITMEDSPRSVVSTKKNSSMAVGLRALAAGEGDAFVSTGNTGALMTGATMYVKCIKGIKRGAIATMLPMERPLLLIDAGSNVTVTADMFCKFALLGSAYMEKAFGVEKPRVGLLNNGAEEHKGTPLTVEAHQMLKSLGGINFVGNIEGNQIPFNSCDVLVTDGFTGNIVLKTMEGFSKFLLGNLKAMYKENAVTLLSAAMVKGKFGKLKKKFDASEYGGAPFLGIAKPVFKAHGGSNAAAVKSAIARAREYLLNDAQSFIEGCIGEAAAEADGE